MSLPRTQTHPRAVGVMPSGGAVANGKPRSVVKITPLKQYAIFYYDETGTQRTNVLIEVDGKLFLAPNGVEWTQSLRPASEWLTKEAKPFLEKENTGGPIVPAADDVDVLGGETNGEAPTGE